MASVFEGTKRRIVAAVVLSVAAVFCFGVSQYRYYLPLLRPTLRPPVNEEPLAAIKLLAPPSAIHSDVSGYDVAEVSRWYSGSACSGRGSDFVGDQPFFPPCRSDLKPGVATWGRYPYVGPFQYMNSSKNPCWKDQGHWRCLPYFYLIGVSKSGTTDLFHRLTGHPQVASTQKELHFFDRNRYNKFHTSFGLYINNFIKVARAVRTDVERTGKSTLICGEGSPSYFYDNYYWQLYSGNENCTEPRVTLAQHIYHLNPNVKLLVIIRHPVHRHPHGLGTPSPDKFHSLVVDGLAKFKDCFQRWSIRHCIYNRTLFQSFAYIRIQENFYSVLLEDWFRVVPRDQFLFIRFEDYARDMASQLNRVYHFFGLRQLTGAQQRKRTTRRKVSNMLPQTEKLLQQMYQPFIRRLAAMLNDRKFLWTDIYPPANSTTVG